METLKCRVLCDLVMFVFTILLLAGAALAHATVPPPYVQSREAFTQVKAYLSEALRPDAGDITTQEGRRHLSFGILAGVTVDLVAANKSDPYYHPLLVLHKTVPYAWSNYQEVALNAQSLLNEASAKVRLIEDLIDNLCDAQSLDQCNAQVQAKVLENSNVYRLSAELLLLLGKASDTVRLYEPKIDSVTNERTEIPYLINNVQSPEYVALVTQLENAYTKMRQLLQHRRMNAPHFDII